MSWVVVRRGPPPLYWTGHDWTPHIEEARSYAYRGDPVLESLRVGGRVRHYDFSTRPDGR